MRRHGVLILAAGLSFSIHLAIAGSWPQNEGIVVGGDVAGEVALGNSFADLVAGTLQSAAPDGDITPTSAATQTKPAQPAYDAIPRVETTMQTVQPDTTTAVSTTSTITPADGERVRQSAVPSGASGSPLAVVAANTPSDVISPSATREAAAVTTSIRPVARPAYRPPVRQAADAPEPAPAPRGNAEVNAAAGRETGTQGGTVAQSSAAQQTTARQVGQGEIDTYKSRVASRVIRVAERMRSRGTQGTVVVGMQIAPNGTLAGATIAQSSGDAAADTIALDAIRRAAPFDPTPTGQSISVAFRVQLVPR